MSREFNESGVDETFVLHPMNLSEDVLYTLYYCGKDTFIMELYEILGAQNLLTLVKCLGGKTVRIPSRMELMKVTRDYVIYKELLSCDEASKAQKRKELAERHELRLDTIYAIEKEVTESLKQIQEVGVVERLKQSSLKKNL